MLRFIFTASIAVTALALSATVAFAQSELDHEKDYTNFAPDTSKGVIVIQVNNKTGQMAVLNAGPNIKSNADAEKIAQEGNFVAVDNDKIISSVKSELDDTKVQTGNYRIRTGWGVVNYGFNYYPSYVWGGVVSQPYYAYAYNDCSYYYYPTAYYAGWNSGWTGGYAGWNGYLPAPVYNYGYGYRGGYGYGYRGNYGYGYRGSYGFGGGYGRRR